MAKGDVAAIVLSNGKQISMEVTVQGRRLTVEEPGPKDQFFIIREHAGQRISRQVRVHKEHLVALDMLVSEDDITYQEV